MPPHSLPPKFLHKVVSLVIMPPSERLLEYVNYTCSVTLQAVLEDSYSKVVMNILDLALN